MTLYEQIINEIVFDVNGQWRKNVYPASIIKNTPGQKSWMFETETGNEVVVIIAGNPDTNYWGIKFTVDGEYIKDAKTKLSFKDFNKLMATVSNIVYVFLKKHEPKYMEWRISNKPFVNYIKQFINAIHQSTTEPIAKNYTAKINTSVDRNNVEHGYFQLFRDNTKYQTSSKNK